MPQVPSNGPPRKRSEDRPETPHSGGSSGIFTALPPGQTAGDGGFHPQKRSGPSPPDLSSEAVEPFPEGFVRLPFPDALIGAMPGLSDSAFRALLGLVRLSFRYDPETSTWVCPDRTFSRAAIEAECGLSGQGTRNGLEELESEGYVSIDRSGRSYEHRLEVEVPSSRFTYVPTDLFEEAPRLSGTELRLVVAVLRATWGWTTDSTETGSGEAPEHKRWARLTVPNLSKLTGRSQSAVKSAAQALQGTWLQRRRPQGGAFYYRFRTEVLTSEVLTTETGPHEEASRPGEVAVQRRRKGVFSMGLPNDLPPDRQRSAPPRRGKKESFPERPAKHTPIPKRAEKTRKESFSRNGGSAVRRGKTPRKGRRGHGPAGRSEKSSIDLTGFSERKRQLGQKLANAGVWPRRIPELLGRFSAERIEANFELFRKRAPQVKNDGAFLAAAIEGGYALPSPSESDVGTGSDVEDSAEGRADTLPAPGTKVSESRRRALLEGGLATEGDFDRFADYDDPTCKQHFYQVEKTPSRAKSPPAANP